MSAGHYDWIIIGSGFGGSVSAHRLTQKLGLKGIFQMSFLRHITVLHGVGVGGELLFSSASPTRRSQTLTSTVKARAE